MKSYILFNVYNTREDANKSRDRIDNVYKPLIHQLKDGKWAVFIKIKEVQNDVQDK